MGIDNEYIFDIEANGLNPDKIHVLSLCNVEDGIIHSTNDYDRMRKFLIRNNITLIGHNIIRFDIPVLERILGIKIKARLIDTLALSWYLEFDRLKHGLESWAIDLGNKKPVIEDWDNLSYNEYKNRCEEDVKNNFDLYNLLYSKLLKMYNNEKQDAEKCIEYLTFKMDCAAEQERSRWKLDVEKATKSLQEMQAEKEEKTKLLAASMPRVPVISKKTRPKKPFKSDGSRSTIGQRWFDLLHSKGLPEDYDGVVEEITKYKEPNPASTPQIKDWLYSLGWKPETYKFVRNKETNEVKQIPQVNSDSGDGVCNSVKKLYKKEPVLEVLDGLSVLTHRIAILKGFISSVDSEGYVRAEVQGITNTMRFKHAVCVNLPGVDRPYGKIIRGVLTAPEGYELCGSDMSSLENRIGQHYMWKFDPEYVRKQMQADYDPHIEMCLTAGLISEEEATLYKETKDKRIHEIRKTGKVAVYACAYGAGVKAIARQANISEKEAKKLHEAYWKLNWSMRSVPKAIQTKTEFGSMWLFNPVSKLWYSLRNEKDVWNTLVQGTGVWCFDTWVKNVRSKRPQLTAQFHDEIVLTIKKGYRDKCTKLLKWAIQETNRQLKLNRNLDVDIQFGENYSEIH